MKMRWTSKILSVSTIRLVEREGKYLSRISSRKISLEKYYSSGKKCKEVLDDGECWRYRAIAFGEYFWCKFCA